MAGRKISCHNCLAKKKPLDTHILAKCPLVSTANRAELIQTLPQLCLGSLNIKKFTGVHTCPPHFKEGGAYSHYFCGQCKSNIELCRSPTTHTATFLGAAVRMDPEEDEQVAAWALHSINRGSLGSSTVLVVLHNPS